jgi:hypothetical protein
MKLFSLTKDARGISAIETIVGVALFVTLGFTIYQTYVKVFKVVELARLRSTMVAVANEEIETVRNLPYASIGEKGGIPNGVLPPSKAEKRGSYVFQIDTTVRNIDDPFDGQVGSTTNNDLSPADSKIVEITVTSTSTGRIENVKLSTRMGPKSLENSSTNGSLFIKVIDASGIPVVGADVHVVNASSSVTIDDVTNVQGMLQIIDAPPGVEAYQVTVTKTGYSTDRTYATGSSTAPSPVVTNPTVLVQQLTQITLTIDRISTLNVYSVQNTCSAVPSIDYSLTGTRMLSTSPVILKYDKNLSTDGAGEQVLNNMEWDTYQLAVNDAGYDLAGTIPLPSLVLSPGSTQNLYLIMKAKNPRAALITVKDSATSLPVADAKVELVDQSTFATTTLYTGRGFLRQTDWSGGSLQATTTSLTKYWSDDGNVDVATTPGDVVLAKVFGDYVSAGVLESSTFDSGSASNFYELTMLPGTQPAEVGLPSVRFQFASGNDPLATSTWSYKGPDGTVATYFTATSTTISSVHNGDRYFRYKAFLNTASTTYSPTLSEVAVTFTSNCVPQGQVYIDGLSLGTYDLYVTKTGYTTATDTVNISSNWQEKQITLYP